jgi:hypothetical protein
MILLAGVLTGLPAGSYIRLKHAAAGYAIPGRVGGRTSL